MIAQKLFDDSVGILGAGPAGLITAYTLLKDGFSNVTLLSKDTAPGGVWSKTRVYPGLTTNSVYGEFRFSPLAMRPTDSDSAGQRSGLEVCAYMETFAETFLKGKIRYGVEVTKVYRPSDDRKGWLLDVRDVKNGSESTETLHFARLVLCTGGCHVPSVPEGLLPTTAKNKGFQGRVFHSSQYRSMLDQLEQDGEDVKALGRVVVIGGGRSALDVASNLANKGASVSIIFQKTDQFVSFPFAIPDFIRRSRLLPILAGHKHLDTRLERFLHTTWIGGKANYLSWKILTEISFITKGVPRDSPLRNADPLFWSVRVNDDSVPREGDFYDLVNKSKITVISPVRATTFGRDGDSDSVVLQDGETIPADTVVLATGYSSSWDIIDEKTATDLGLARHPPDRSWRNQWDYTSFIDPPSAPPDEDQWSASIYRGIIPAKNLLNHDLAINGGIFATNNGYSYEVVAHWISSYFLRDPYLKIPKTVEEALESCERDAAWIRRRWPGALSSVNPSYSGSIAFWSWPQVTDELLRDMGLKTLRSGGNWLTWPFKTMDLDHIATLGEERRCRW